VPFATGLQRALKAGQTTAPSTPGNVPEDRVVRGEGCRTTKKARPEALLFKLQWLDL
jgi:hypothetical protein